MTGLKRIVRTALLLLLMNGPLLLSLREGGLSPAFKTAAGLLLGFHYLFCLVVPERREKKMSPRLSVMMGGRVLILLSLYCFAAETLLYGSLAVSGQLLRDWRLFLVNGVLALSLMFLLLFSGFVRIVFTSGQLGVTMRILLLFTWWIPLWNLYLLIRACGVVKREYYFELSKRELNERRRENEVCATRYPILLVHGIFFRDWQFLNYWGRIPGELIRNGANVYYGKQQSAAPVAVSAQELAGRIQEILKETGSEKVNIIAHSKGGLDSRYAVSRLGMADHVASLTTINTPHRGCIFAQRLLKMLPDALVSFVARRYNGIFQRLGDKDPDFLGGVLDLTADRCKVFNEETKNCEGVYYQSVASKMKGVFSAGFPLFLTYPIVRWVEGENDGLVTPSSAEWGNYLGLITGNRYRGVSHGDMVDLMRENIQGFDVTEFYVNVVKDLKERGF